MPNEPMIHHAEYQLARIILREPDRFNVTGVELRALEALLSAYEQGAPFEAKDHRLTRLLMISIANEALAT